MTVPTPYFPTLTGEIAFATAPLATPTWEDISTYLREGSCRRGRPNEQTRIEAGQMGWLLENVDRRFDPTHASGPYYPNVIPTRKARLRALAPGFGTALTLSGNEITDAVRLAATSGDGRTWPDSSYGIWEATTNSHPNGGGETNTTRWSTLIGGTISRVTSAFKFGVACVKYVSAGAAANEGIAPDTATGLASAAGANWKSSVWLKGEVGGEQIRILTRITNTDATTTDGTSTDITLTTDWVRYEAVAVAVAVGKTGNQVACHVRTRLGVPLAWTMYCDGLQIEAQPLATPYVHTDGATATRAAARVQAPASLLDETQGWVAMRVRMGWASAVLPTSGCRFMWWGVNDGRIALGATTTTIQLISDTGPNDIVNQNFTFAKDEIITVIAAWTATQIKVSANGAAFSTPVARTAVPTIASATFGIGYRDEGANTEEIDSDVLWFACGTGTLTDTDAAVIGGWDDEEAGLTSALAQLGAAAAPTMVWHADTASPIVPTTHSLFTGYADRWPQEWEMPDYAEVPITFSDAFELLAAADIGAGTAWPAELSGTRLGRALDAVSWPAADRVLDAGQVVVVASTIDTDDGIKALGHLQDVADSESMGGGVLFMDGQGRVVFHDKHHRLKPVSVYTSLATFGDNGWPEIDYEDLVPDYDKDRITNDWRITPSGGAVIKVEDSTSITNHFRRTQRRTPLVSDVNECQSQAEYLTALTKSPLLRFDRIDFAPSHLADGRLADYTWANALGREIGERVTVKKRPPGGGSAISQDCHIEGISHEFTDQAWRTTWLLSPADPLTYWILGDSVYSLLGVTTRLAP